MPGRAEVGEFGVDVDGDGAEQPDVLAAGRGDVGQQRVLDPPPLPAQLVDGQPEILRESRLQSVGNATRIPPPSE